MTQLGKFDETWEAQDATNKVVASCREELTKLLGTTLIESESDYSEERCGVFGCIWPLTAGRYRGQIAKITTDTREAVMAEYLRVATGVPAMLPHVTGAYQLNCAPARAPYYLIIREDLIDRPDGDPLGVLTSEIEMWQRARWAAGRAQSSAGRGWRRRRARAAGNDIHHGLVTALRRYGNMSMDDMDRDGSTQRNPVGNIENAIEFVRWIERAGIAFGDLHDGNWGWRRSTRELVIRDLGVSYIDAARDPWADPRLATMSRLGKILTRATARLDGTRR